MVSGFNLLGIWIFIIFRSKGQIQMRFCTEFIGNTHHRSVYYLQHSYLKIKTRQVANPSFLSELMTPFSCWVTIALNCTSVTTIEKDKARNSEKKATAESFFEKLTYKNRNTIKVVPRKLKWNCNVKNIENMPGNNRRATFGGNFQIDASSHAPLTRLAPSHTDHRNI